MKALDFTFNTPFKKGLKLSEEVKKADTTFLIFLRYFGCTSCQVDMIGLAEEYEKFKAKNAQVLVVLQSRGEIAKDGSERFNLPYDIVCDPDAEIYRLYDVRSATTEKLANDDPRKGELLRGKATKEQTEKFEKKMARREELGLTHGEYEGDEYQLPGYFIIDKDMNLLKSHRAVAISDMPLADEYLDLI